MYDFYLTVPNTSPDGVLPATRPGLATGGGLS